MGYVDRGGGREAKGASLRRSKKNPGCGASRQLNKVQATTAPVDPAQRPPAVPPPMFTAPFHSLSAPSVMGKKNDNPVLLLNLKKKMEQEGDCKRESLPTMDLTDPRLLARLLSSSTDKVLYSAAQLVEAMAVYTGVEQSGGAPETGSAYHLDSAVALFSRRLVEENTQDLSRRALDEGRVSGMLCWSSEVERQAALVTHCETTLQGTPYSSMAVFKKNESAETKVNINEENNNNDHSNRAELNVAEGQPKSCLVSDGSPKGKHASKREMNREKEFKEEKRVHFDPSTPFTTVYKTDDPPSNGSTPLPNFSSETPSAYKDGASFSQADEEVPVTVSSAENTSNGGSKGTSDTHSNPTSVSYNLEASLPYVVVGVHPNNIDRMNQTLQEQWLATTASLALKPAATTNSVSSTTSSTTRAGDPAVTLKSVVGGPAIVGLLSGLDLSRKSGTHHAQEWVLRKLYKMAAALELPLVLHLRVDAAAGGNAVSVTSGAPSGVSFFAEPRTRTAMQQTGDRLAELLQEWCKWKSVENQTHDTPFNERDDESGDDEDDDEDDDDEKENDNGADGAENASAALLLSKQVRGGKKRSRHPPAIVLHNAWATLALSPALQALFPLSRRHLKAIAAENGTNKNLRQRPVLFLSVSAEEMLSTSSDPIGSSSEERQMLLSVLPSLPPCKEMKIAPSDKEDIVTLTQLLITTASPWHTPSNLDDEYLRTRPNEPANYPYVVKAVLSALLEKVNVKWEMNSHHLAKLETLLQTVSTVNALALFFGRYWVHRHHVEEQHLEDLAQLSVQASQNTVTSTSAVEAPSSSSLSEGKRNITPVVKPVAQYRCAGCQATLFHSTQALWHLHDGEDLKTGPTRASLLTCANASDSTYQLPVPLPPAVLHAERHQDRLVRIDPDKPKAGSTPYDTTSIIAKKSKSKKNKKNKRQYQDSESDNEDVGADHGGKTSTFHEGVTRLEGEEECRINLHSTSIQAPLRAALTSRFGKSFWVLSASGTAVGVACAQCKARLGVLGAIPFLAQLRENDEHISDDDTDDDDTSSDDDDNFLTGSSSRHKKKKRHDKLARKKQLKRELHAKHVQHQRGAFNGGAMEGSGAFTADAASFRALPTICRRCDNALTWSGYDASPNAFPLAVVLYVDRRSVVECATRSHDDTAVTSADVVVSGKEEEEVSSKRNGNAAGKQQGKSTRRKNNAAAVVVGTKSKPSSSSLEEEMEQLRQQHQMEEEQEEEEREEEQEDDDDGNEKAYPPFAVKGTEEDNELARLLREAALEREAIDREKEMEEQRWAEEQEALKRQQKKQPKKNVKANNRSNFTHFRNKDFGKNVPGGVVPPSTLSKRRSDEGDSSESD